MLEAYHPVSARPQLALAARPTGEARNMPNDAKLGLIVGVGVVILVAVVFFRKDAGSGQPGDPVPASMGGKPGAAPRDLYRPVRASTSAQTKENPAEPPAERKHVV